MRVILRKCKTRVGAAITSKALAPLGSRRMVRFATPQDWLQKSTFEHAIASVHRHPIALEVINTRHQGEHLILPI